MRRKNADSTITTPVDRVSSDAAKVAKCSSPLPGEKLRAMFEPSTKLLTVDLVLQLNVAADLGVNQCEIESVCI